MKAYNEDGSDKELHDLIKKMNNATDIELAKRALKIFYERYSRLLAVFLYGRCSSESIIDQVINEVLKAVWNNREDLKHTRKPFSWLKTVTIHKLVDEYRKEKNELPLDDRIPASNNPIDDVDDKCAYQDMIECLSLQEREIVTDKVLFKSTFKEIAKDRNLPVPTVSSIYYRALDKVRSSYLQKNPEE